MLKSLNSCCCCCCCCCFVWSDSLGWLQDSLGGGSKFLCPSSKILVLWFRFKSLSSLLWFICLSSLPSHLVSCLSCHLISRFLSLIFFLFRREREREREREILWDASKIPGSLCESAKVSSRKELSQSVPRKRASLGRGWDSQGCSRILDPNWWRFNYTRSMRRNRNWRVRFLPDWLKMLQGQGFLRDSREILGRFLSDSWAILERWLPTWMWWNQKLDWSRRMEAKCRVAAGDSCQILGGCSTIHWESITLASTAGHSLTNRSRLLEEKWLGLGYQFANPMKLDTWNWYLNQLTIYPI